VLSTAEYSRTAALLAVPSCSDYTQLDTISTYNSLDDRNFVAQAKRHIKRLSAQTSWSISNRTTSNWIKPLCSPFIHLARVAKLETYFRGDCAGALYSMLMSLDAHLRSVTIKVDDSSKTKGTFEYVKEKNMKYTATGSWENDSSCPCDNLFLMINSSNVPDWEIAQTTHNIDFVTTVLPWQDTVER